MMVTTTRLSDSEGWTLTPIVTASGAEAAGPIFPGDHLENSVV